MSDGQQRVRRAARWRRVPLLLAFAFAPAADLAGLSAEGSLYIQAGPSKLVDSVPAGSLPDWTGLALLSSRINGSAASAEMALEGALAHDAASRTDALFLEELWASWKPVDGLTLRLGRQRIGFGCGFAWSVVDDLDPQPMPFDPHSPRVGLDALRFSADLAPRGAPIQISLEAFAPRESGAQSLMILNATGREPDALLGKPVAGFPHLDDCGGAAQLSTFLEGIELGVAGALRELGTDRHGSLGGWATIDLAGFVIGTEAAWRQQGAELLLNCNRRLGDFSAVTEARWVPNDDRLWLFGELSWSRAEITAALAALFSVREACGLVDATLSYAAADSLVLSVGATVYEKAQDLPEIGPLPWWYSLCLGAEYFF